MNYFLDTNIISDIVKISNKDKDTISQKDMDLISKIGNILTDNSSTLFINRLVKLESLRAIPVKHKKLFNNTQDTLNLFREVDITPKIYSKAIDFARYCKSKGFNFGKCEAIDYIHFITAKYYELEMISNDKDMEKLEEVYIEFIS